MESKEPKKQPSIRAQIVKIFYDSLGPTGKRYWKKNNILDITLPQSLFFEKLPHIDKQILRVTL